MLEQILVPLDGSLLAEAVLPHVEALARTFSSQVNLLRILERPVVADLSSSTDPLEWLIKSAEAKSYLNGIKQKLETDEVSAQATLLECRAAEQIVEFSQNTPTDLIVLSSHGQHGFSSWKVSSVGQQIIQLMPTSVLLIRAKQAMTARSPSEGYRRLLVPLDGSWRAETALPIAMSIAQAYEAELLLVHIVAVPEMARHLPLTAEDNELATRLIERNREEGQNYLAQKKAQLPGKIQTRLEVSQNVAKALQDIVIQEQVDLVVLSAHGFSGEAQVPYGSVASRFITEGTTPLLIIQDVRQEKAVA